MIDTIPFDMVFDASPPFAGRTVELTLEMESEDGLEEMADMFDCLCALAQLGTFSDVLSDEPPPAAWASEAYVRGAVWRRALALGRLDPSFWRVLLQMAVQCHYHSAPIERLFVRDASPHGAFVSVGDLLNAPYLPSPRHLPFKLVRADDPVRDVVAIRATAASLVGDEAFAAIKKAFEDWGSLVYVGGFASAAAAIEDYQIDRFEVGRLDLTLVECAAFNWNAPQEAIDYAIRLCGGLHRHVVPIVEVEVE
jgi:hypothetical protein